MGLEFIGQLAVYLSFAYVIYRWLTRDHRKKKEQAQQEKQKQQP